MLLKKHIMFIMLISLAQSGLWFFAFILCSLFLEDNIKLVCIFLLVAYLLVAQPVKDLFLIYFWNRKKEQLKFKELDILVELDDTKEVKNSFPILKSIIRKLKISYIDFHFLILKPYLSRIYNERTLRTRSVENFRNPELEAYIQNEPWGKNIENYPSELKTYLAEKKIQCIVPISFRGIMLGFFSFPHTLEQNQIETFEYIARRLSLIIHNQSLDHNINLSKEVEKSFLLARKIKSFLEYKSHVRIFDYTIDKVNDGWHNKYFPVYYEIKSRTPANINQKPISYVILCRPNKNLQKKANINLCLIQGYFISFCESSSNLIKLASRLQNVIKELDDEKIHLEGFLILLKETEMRIHYFGRQLMIIQDSTHLVLKDSPPLGSPAWELLNIIRVEFNHEVTLMIRNYPLLLIKYHEPMQVGDRSQKNFIINSFQSIKENIGTNFKAISRK